MVKYNGLKQLGTWLRMVGDNDRKFIEVVTHAGTEDRQWAFETFARAYWKVPFEMVHAGSVLRNGSRAQQWGECKIKFL